MHFSVIKTNTEEIKPFRLLFLQQNNFQFVHNKCHDYGWADSYMIYCNDEKIGYGSVWGMNNRQDRDAIFEFFLLPAYEKYAHLVFPVFRAACNATYIQCQTNEKLLPELLFEFAENINAESILFEDHYTTHFTIANTIFRTRESTDNVPEDCGDQLLLYNDMIVADGGLMLNYNMPFADIYMHVAETHRQKGFGTLMVQELKKKAYAINRVPAARCNIRNKASKTTLLKAGMKICGYLVNGKIKEGF